MGKCISKDQQLKIREIDERSYIAITDEFEYYHYDEVYDEDEKFVEDEVSFVKISQNFLRL